MEAEKISQKARRAAAAFLITYVTLVLALGSSYIMGRVNERAPTWLQPAYGQSVLFTPPPVSYFPFSLKPSPCPRRIQENASQLFHSLFRETQ